MQRSGTEQRRLAAIMFTDMVGYSALAQRNEPLALAGLADCLGLIANSDFQAVKEVMPRAEAAAQCAVQLAPMLAETHTALGHVKAMFRWDWSEAQRCYRRALELDPTQTPAYFWYALLLDLLGRGDDAVAASLRAIELDPLPPAVAGSAGWRFVFARQFERGAEFGQRIRRLNQPPARLRRTRVGFALGSELAAPR